jgi:hypothetical protein
VLAAVAGTKRSILAVMSIALSLAGNTMNN